MGPAVSSAITLACTLAQDHQDSIEIMSVDTGTSAVVDDIYPTDVNEDIEQRARNKSTVKICFEMRKVTKEEGHVEEKRKVPAFVHFQRLPKARRLHK
jgi:hypothetical protein